MSDHNGPACAYCGKRYDFARRPVRIENCCWFCLSDSPLSWIGWPRRFRLIGRSR